MRKRTPKITKEKLKQFIERYKKNPDSIPMASRVLNSSKAKFSETGLVQIKRERKKESVVLKRFYGLWLNALAEHKIKPKYYSLKPYRVYPIKKEGPTTHTIASYYLRPSISDIEQFCLGRSIKESRDWKGLLYAENLIKKSGLKKEQFIEKLKQAEKELVNHIGLFKEKSSVKYFDTNVLVYSYNKNKETRQFTLILIDPF